MGGLGRAHGKPGYHSPNVGGSVSSKRTITEANGEPMPKVIRSSISHQKLSSVPLWHLTVLNPAMARPRNLGTTYLMFGAYPRERTGEVEHRLRSLAESNQGRFLPAADAHRAWGERYFPIRPSILPPGLSGLSREFSSVAELSQRLEQVEDSATSVALQGTIARSGEILLLTLDAREMT